MSQIDALKYQVFHSQNFPRPWINDQWPNESNTRYC